MPRESGKSPPAARDLAAIGVRVNTVAPGIIDTPIYGTGPASEEFKAKLAAPVVFPKRMGTADEFAHLVALAEDCFRDRLAGEELGRGLFLFVLQCKFNRALAEFPLLSQLAAEVR